MRRNRAAIAIAASVLGASLLSAQPGPPGPGTSPPFGPPRPPLERVLDALVLSPDQDTRVGDLLRARHDAADSSRLEVDAAHRELAAQVTAEPFDEPAIRAKAAAVAALEADRFVEDAALLREVRALLTDEQRRELDRFLAQTRP